MGEEEQKQEPVASSQNPAVSSAPPIPNSGMTVVEVKPPKRKQKSKKAKNAKRKPHAGKVKKAKNAVAKFFERAIDKAAERTEIIKPAPAWWDTFAVEYLKNGENGTAAYRKCRPKVAKSTAEAESSRLIVDHRFSQVLRRHRDAIIDDADMSRREWVKNLCHVARFDMRNYLERSPTSGALRLADNWKERADGHVFEKIKVTNKILKGMGDEDSGVQLVEEEIELKSCSKLKSLEILGKALGYLEDKVDVTSGGKPVAVVGLPPLNND